VSLNKLGDFYLARGQAGDAERALTQFEESHRTLKGLFEANPNSAQAATDVAISNERLGDFQRDLGETDAAFNHYTRSFELWDSLRKANPESAHFAKGICVPINRLGDFYRARGQAGDAERALTQFEESLQIRKQLFEANPNSAQAARDLLVSQERLSDLAGSSDAADAASRALELQSQALQLALALHQANPASASVGQDAADSAIRTARKAHAAGQEEIASQSLGVCYSVLHTLVQNGCELNQTMTNLFQQLQRTLGNSAQEDAT
jgi:tetratricopeptide (TPR) repeat protein